MGKNKTKKRTRRPNKGWLAGSSATQTICSSFLLVIAVGTLLLTLPISSRTGRLGVIDAMFTATSATCVTGLVVRDTWSQFSLFGQVIILMLIQVGGLGLVTLTSFFALAARRRMGFRDLRLLGESVSADGLSKATEVLKIVIKLAAAFEAVGIVLLLFAFVPQFGAEGVWVSVFTAISAFCNAGFDLFGRFGAYSSLVPYVNNYYVQAVIMFMIMAGGLGFMVWVELAEYRKKRRLSLHAKVVLQFSVIFWVGGAVLLALLEWSNPRTMGGLSVPGKIMAALFQSVSTRTAGMNTIDLAACSPISKLLMSVLQFIGAAPGSTGGGVKVTTFAVLILTIRSVAQGRDDCVIGGPPHRVQDGLPCSDHHRHRRGSGVRLCRRGVLQHRRDGVGHRLHLRVLLGVRYGGPVGRCHWTAEHRREAAVYGLYVHGPRWPGVAGNQPDGKARRQQAQSPPGGSHQRRLNKKRALHLSGETEEHPLSLIINCPVPSGALQERPESADAGGRRPHTCRSGRSEWPFRHQGSRLSTAGGGRPYCRTSRACSRC